MYKKPDNRRKLPIKEVRQIAYEIALWAQDAKELEQSKKTLNQPIKQTFKEKFDEHIDKRINMALSKIDKNKKVINT